MTTAAKTYTLLGGPFDGKARVLPPGTSEFYVTCANGDVGAYIVTHVSGRERVLWNGDGTTPVSRKTEYRRLNIETLSDSRIPLEDALLAEINDAMRSLFSAGVHPATSRLAIDGRADHYILHASGFTVPAYERGDSTGLSLDIPKGETL